MRRLAATGLGILLLLSACGGAWPEPATRAAPTRAPTPRDPRQPLAQAVAHLEQDLAEARALLAALATSPEVQSGSAAVCSAFVARILEAHPQFAQLGATTPNGILFCNSYSQWRAPSVADRLYFSRALASQDFAVGEFVIGRVTRLPALGLAYPIRGDDHAVKGIVIAPLKLSFIIQQFATIDIPATGEIVLLDSYGNILVRDPDAVEWLGRNIAETSLGQAMLTHHRGMGEYAGADGEKRAYAFAAPQGSNEHLIVAVGIK